MNIVIRVDSSQQIGSGHLVRCRTLAEELRRRGAEVCFICREHSGHISEWLSQSTFPVILLPPPPKPAKMSENYRDWLGVSQETDAAETINALGQIKPDWLIVDHYSLDQVWEQLLRPYVNKILVIDDLANRPHDCDGLLDQNENLEGEIRYQRLVPKHCRVLVGCRYALLRPEYAEYRKTLKPRTGEIKRIFIFFGGTDPDNMTGMAIAVLSSPEFKDITLDVVIGVTSSHRETIELQAKERGNINVYGSRPHLADLMAQADLAIGAGGVTNWERCTLGLPTLVISIAKNQIKICENLARSDQIIYLGDSTKISANDFKNQLVYLLKNLQIAQSTSIAAFLLCDGLGTLRTVEFLIPTNKSGLSFRPAFKDDLFIYFQWVNDLEVRKQSLNTQSILWAEHSKWFRNRIKSKNCLMKVLEVNNLPVGQIRFEINNHIAYVAYSLDSYVRGRGWAKQLVQMGISHVMNEFPQVKTVQAIVKSENFKSKLIFKKLGFKKVKKHKNNIMVFEKSLNQQSVIIE